MIKQWLSFLIALFIILSFVIGISGCSLLMHKQAMERISGHPVTWWDAYWTK